MNVPDLKTDASEIIDAALNSVDPYHLLAEQIRISEGVLFFPHAVILDPAKYERIFIIGAGKGVAPMARAMEQLLGENLTAGAIIVKYGHLDDLHRIKIYEAGHPVPDENSLKYTRDICDLVGDLNENDCVIVLLTGGGSALMEILPEGIGLSDLQEVSKAMLACSAGIHEMNCVRKHISLVKGGQLARMIHPARCITLALSDVIGDDLSVIASGPTHTDETTYSDAIGILRKYKIDQTVPPQIIRHLENGIAGKIADTPKTGESIFEQVDNIVIGSNRLALNAAASRATKLGYNTLIFTSRLEGEAREIARVIAAVMHEVLSSGMPVGRPACLLLGGEPTVHLTGSGKGGRNQELALAVSIAMQHSEQPFLFASCGSDGTDGPTDAAGAIVTTNTAGLAAGLDLDPVLYLANNDAYNFFDRIDGLIRTGPTRTNVMDIILALIP